MVSKLSIEGILYIDFRDFKQCRFPFRHILYMVSDLPGRGYERSQAHWSGHMSWRCYWEFLTSVWGLSIVIRDDKLSIPLIFDILASDMMCSEPARRFSNSPAIPRFTYLHETSNAVLFPQVASKIGGSVAPSTPISTCVGNVSPADPPKIGGNGGLRGQLSSKTRPVWKAK